MQFHAGYCLDSVLSNLIENGREKDKVDGLLKELSSFEVEGITKNDTNDIDPVVAVVNNIITRGLPTKPTTFVEETLIKETLSGTKNMDNLGKISYKIKDGLIFSRLLYRSLHLIDPEIKLENLPDDKLSFLENRFLKVLSPNILHPFLSQIWEQQKYLETIIEGDNISKDFKNQRADFAIKFPYLIKNKQGVIIETDGNHHEKEEQKILDVKRDKNIELSNWFKTNRIKYEDTDDIINEKLTDIKDLLSEEYFKNLKENYEHPLFLSTEGVKALKLTLTPIGIARIQKTIIELIINGTLKLDSDVWKIGIIERDIPCGKLALKDLEQIFVNLFELENNYRKLPEIILEVFNVSSIIDFKNKNNFENKTSNKFDLVIDISILKRHGFLENEILINANSSVKIRSSFSSTFKRKFYTTDLIKYPNFQKLNKEHQHEKKRALIFFLQWIFRNNNYRVGQLKIINAILQLKNSLALLPTGGGKSLTYQLCSFLQPGITIVVDPIKSLMKDQNQSLLKMQIDCSIVINSATKDPSEKKLLMENMSNGESLFIFLSPERFLIKEFREKLIEAFHQNHTYFSYCVIDEVHCVSEWGHDFRTAYLRLGENARNFCKRKNGESITLIGLTATASYDVLEDVQRELKIKDKNVIRSEYLDRPELQYHIIEVAAENNNSDDNRTKEIAVSKLISQIPQRIKEANLIYLKDEKKKSFALNENYFQNQINWKDIPGLVFCPYKGNYFGVLGVANEISRKINAINVGTFMGSSDNNQDEQISSQNQDKFLDDKLDLMVATKAFGMGIDKPNIRYTIHLNYPNSIESFYQEAGRSGRDKQLALCYILFSKTPGKDKTIPLGFHNNSFKGIEKEKWVLAELINKVEKNLEILQFGDKAFIVIEFDNHIDQKIKSIIEKSEGINIDLKKIQDAYSWCQDPKRFVLNINKNLRKNISSKETIDEIEEMFWKWRCVEDTSKAIYRLSAIEVIDDYTINYNEKSYSVEICKKTEEELYSKYYEYLKRYLSIEKAKNEISLSRVHKGNSTIQKCTGSLIEFVYKEIEDKRRRSIDSMELACLEGLQKGSTELEEFMKMYFDSKYYNDLVEETKEGKEYTFYLVWKYIKENGIIGGKIDNIKHLRGATLRLLNDNPNNAGLLLMNAYSYLVLETKNKEIRNKSAEDILKAFGIFIKENKLTPIEYFNSIEMFKNCILNSNSKIDNLLTQTFELLEIKFHTNWLKNYNLQNIN